MRANRTFLPTVSGDAIYYSDVIGEDGLSVTDAGEQTFGNFTQTVLTPDGFASVANAFAGPAGEDVIINWYDTEGAVLATVDISKPATFPFIDSPDDRLINETSNGWLIMQRAPSGLNQPYAINRSGVSRTVPQFEGGPGVVTLASPSFDKVIVYGGFTIQLWDPENDEETAVVFRGGSDYPNLGIDEGVEFVRGDDGGAILVGYADGTPPSIIRLGPGLAGLYTTQFDFDEVGAYPSNSSVNSQVYVLVSASGEVIAAPTDFVGGTRISCTALSEINALSADDIQPLATSGNRVVFLVTPPGGGDFNVYIGDVAEGATTSLTDLGTVSNNNFTYVPNSSLVAFQPNDETGDTAKILDAVSETIVEADSLTPPAIDPGGWTVTYRSFMADPLWGSEIEETEIPPFWTAFNGTFERVNVPVSGPDYTVFDHPSPNQYDWNGDRISTLDTRYSVASGGEFINGHPVNNDGDVMTLDYTDAEGGYNLKIYVGIHAITDVAGAGPFTCRITLVNNSGTEYTGDVNLRVPGPEDDNGVYVEGKITNDSQEYNEIFGPSFLGGLVASDFPPKLIDGFSQPGLDGPNVSQVRISCIDGDDNLVDGVRMAVVAAVTDTPT